MLQAPLQAGGALRGARQRPLLAHLESGEGLGGCGVTPSDRSWSGPAESSLVRGPVLPGAKSHGRRPSGNPRCFLPVSDDTAGLEQTAWILGHPAT